MTSAPKPFKPFAALRARLRSFTKSLRAHDETESHIREEFESHIAMRAAHLIQSGTPAVDAERQARREFGHMESHRVNARSARGLRRVDQIRVSWIDIKLGLRMLTKHPVLSFASVFALAVGIPIGLAPSHLAGALNAPLPGDRDNRVRAIRYWDPSTVSVASTRFENFDTWSRSSSSFSLLAAFRPVTLNVSVNNGRSEPVASAQLTGSAFDILRTQPQLGRTINRTDTERGASTVAVIGHRLWETRFNSDANIIGRTVRVGGQVTTIVGVMPAGFRFPSNEQLWIPLQNETAGAGSSGASLQILGRLADGVSDEQAQAALAAIAMPNIGDAAQNERLNRLRVEVVPFGLLYVGLPRGGLTALPEFRLVQVLMLAVLLVACGNVAMLVFARTATRLREIAIRTALGASRSRIVSQIFAETFVLSAVSAVVGVLTVDWIVGHFNIASIVGYAAIPYWLTLDITRGTVINATVLATLCATVAGVIPAIRITGRAVNQNIRAFSAVRFGKLTGALVVADIAVAVIAVGLSMTIVRQMLELRGQQTSGIAAREYLAVEFRTSDALQPESTVEDRERSASHRATVQRALVTALASEPGITGVAISDALPMMEHRSRPYELDGANGGDVGSTKWVRTASVDVEYFRALGQTVVKGRDFTGSDAENEPSAIIVNEPFVQRVLGGREAIGQRVRFPSGRKRSGNANDERWYQIVGVVRHLGVNMVNAENGEAVYFPAAAGSLNPMQIALHVGQSPLKLMPRVREIAGNVDPDLAITNSIALGDQRQSDWYLTLGAGGALTLLAAVLVALATSGLFAMLSLSVTERTREIGIRSALGATRVMLVLTVLRRSLVQIGIGALIGLPVAVYLNVSVAIEAHNSAFTAFLTAGALATGLVVLVGVLSCLVPTRRVLAVQATEAMRAEA